MSASGTELRLAIKKAATWGTAVACGAGDGILFLPGGPKYSRPDNVDDSLGLGFPTDSDRGEIKVEGSRKAYLRYRSADLPIAMAMGTSGAPTLGGTPVEFHCDGAGTITTAVKSTAGMTPDAEIGKWFVIDADSGNPSNVGQVRKITDNDATTLTWVGALPAATSATTQGKISNGIATHVYDLADMLDGLFVTIARKTGTVNVEEIPSAKIAGFTISGETGKPCDIVFDILGSTIKWDSVVNTLVTFADVTFPEIANRVLRSHGVFRMNDMSGGALASPGDVIQPNSFQLIFKRNLAGVYGLGSDADIIDEPTNNGLSSIQLKLGFPRYTSAAKFTEWAAKTAKKLDMVFTGALLAGAVYRTFKIEIPHLEYAEVDCPEEVGILKNPVTFNVLQAAAAPTGMSFTTPFRITTINDYCGDPLQVGN